MFENQFLIMILSMKKRRALSTVVTSAIMLTAVAVMGTGVVIWANSNLKTFDTNLSTSASNNLNKINELPIIENVILIPNYNINQNAVNVTVSNIGTIGFKVQNITISDSTQKTTFNMKPSDGIIKPHSYWYTKDPNTQTPLLYQWKPGYITTVTITTARGTQISTQVSHS